ncbi:MAG: family 78 glycoside hydrolase catalytic domain [Oscillospiraceae bacterium]|nr:family 78 glycoside hydrolase catalytic domain [Oscillospiraceae bacterium]
MLTISEIRIENQTRAVITDRKRPRFSFALASDRQGCRLETYRIRVSCGDELFWDSGEREDKRQIAIVYRGRPLDPFTAYTVTVSAADNFGERAEADAAFSTGRLDIPWQAKWITDATLPVPEKSSPVPLLFRRCFTLGERPVRAWINATALGVYELYLNGGKLGDRYFAPGFTSYPSQIQYQTYEIPGLAAGENELKVRVGAGWAVGAFTFTRTNQTYADTPALLLELHLIYADGRSEVLCSDKTWEVSRDGALRFADFYDGEVYDAAVDEDTIAYKPVDLAVRRSQGSIEAEYGAPVKAIRKLEPAAVFTSPGGERVYDFGQNFAGVIDAEILGKQGQKISFRHAEVLEGGELFVKPLRTAKARIDYTCREGKQHYSPSMTYMGFRYVGVRGIAEKDLQLTALVLSSDMEETGRFSCSDERLNQLQHNILWGGRSNFVDIPTDCPQRDERMGWTGDIAVFARTACFNFDMSRFLEKWLRDLASEQTESGALPMTCPRAEDSWKKRATGCWGDACVLVPWAEYLSRGDEELLRCCYPMMKKFLGECERRAGLFSLGAHRRIWSLPFQFGDWCAPDGSFAKWVLRGKWVATAYFANSCRIVSEIAKILGETADSAYFEKLYREISAAYTAILCRKSGRLKKEFQTAYVLPLAFGLVRGVQEQTMADRLAEMVKDADFSPRAGFPGTPYLLFSLADHGKEDTAFRTLLSESCPGWLYAVKAGATTIWERWDALRPDGTVNTGGHGRDGGMVSFNHYANGAAGDFLYRRIAGLEAAEGGYRRFTVAPKTGGGLRYAEAEVKTPYGLIRAAWRIEGNEFTQTLTVPVSTVCTVILPSGKTETCPAGSYVFREAYTGQASRP